MTPDEAIEIVAKNEDREYFGPLVSEPNWTFRTLYEYYLDEPADSDDLFILRCDIENRIDSCSLPAPLASQLKRLLLKRN